MSETDVDISREDVRPSKIQYQLLTAGLAIGDAFESVEDAPAGVTEALEHIQTAMNLFANPDEPLSECRPDETVELAEAEQVHSELTDNDWDALAESEFVDVAYSEIGDDTAFVFDHPRIGLHGFRWRKHSKTLESVVYNRIGGDESDAERD